MKKYILTIIISYWTLIVFAQGEQKSTTFHSGSVLGSVGVQNNFGVVGAFYGEANNATQKTEIGFLEAIFGEKALQSVSFPPLAVKTFGDVDFTLSATSSSGLPVTTFESSDISVATISGNTVTIVGSGAATILAKQEGSIAFLPAVASQVLLVNKAGQTLTWIQVFEDVKVGNRIRLEAVSSVGLPVTYTVNNRNLALVDLDSLEIIGSGLITVTAQQLGNANYNASLAEQKTFISSVSLIAPSNLIVESVDASGIRLSWQNNDQTATGIQVWKRVNDGVPSPLSTLPANFNSLTDFADYDAGSTYFYQVRATGLDNTASEFSNMIGAVPLSGSETPTLESPNELPYDYQGLWVYPNPSAGIFKVFLPVGTEAASITITNAQGQVILETATTPNAEEIELDLSAYVAGQYYLQVKRNGRILTRTLVKE